MPCRTLIVEDDRVSAQSLSALVHMLGHEVAVAGTVREALEKVRAFKPECVLLDLQLPDGTGAAVLAAIRAEGLDAKVAIISALEPGDPDFDAVQPLQPDVVFQKPLGIARVQRWLAAL